jgi:hypothetical protein
MSNTYILGRKFSIENDHLILRLATFPSNVSPQPRGTPRSFDYHPCLNIPIADHEGIALYFEALSCEMDGGMLRRGREWIDGGQAWAYWTRALSRELNLELRSPRLSKIYYYEIPRYLFGAASPIDGLETLEKDAIINPRLAHELVENNLSVQVRCERPYHRPYRGRLGFITSTGGVAIYLPRHSRNGVSIEGELYVEHRTSLSNVEFGPVIPPAPSPFGRRSDREICLVDPATDLWLLVNDKERLIIQEKRGSLSTAPLSSLRYYDAPLAFTLAHARLALTRIEKHLPETDWHLVPAHSFQNPPLRKTEIPDLDESIS